MCCGVGGVGIDPARGCNMKAPMERLHSCIPGQPEVKREKNIREHTDQRWLVGVQTVVGHGFISGCEQKDSCLAPLCCTWSARCDSGFGGLTNWCLTHI